ncbi:NAD(P)H-dependent oxidoreductase [Saprospiraceae bacterium]|nr:NAD(P)H-dependent oxidoreductase [Saprospiraceae bacterium]
MNGKARSNNNTAKIVQHLLGEDLNLIELSEFKVSQYDYSSNYNEDDSFQNIADRMIKADVIIISTPIYW